ncbi:hypothetical protein ACTXT7_007112 [Hymenolepis weldensis]
MSKQRKFVQQLTHGGYMSQKSVDNEVTTEDSFSNLKISCVSEPIDYEQYLVRNKASIMNDPHRDLVLFPADEVKLIKIMILQRIDYVLFSRSTLTGYAPIYLYGIEENRKLIKNPFHKVAGIKIVRLNRTQLNTVGGGPPSASIAELTKISALARHVEATCMPQSWCLLQEPLARFRGPFCDLPKDPFIVSTTECEVIVFWQDNRFSSHSIWQGSPQALIRTFLIVYEKDGRMSNNEGTVEESRLRLVRLQNQEFQETDHER